MGNEANGTKAKTRQHQPAFKRVPGVGGGVIPADQLLIDHVIGGDHMIWDQLAPNAPAAAPVCFCAAI